MADQFHPAEQAKALTRRRWREQYYPGKTLTDDMKAELDKVPTDPALEAECWAGRARMAHARQHAGVPLDSIDEEALRRHPVFCPVGPVVVA